MITKEKIYQLGLVLAILIIGGLLFKSCQDSKILTEIKTEESNLRKALTDTLTHFETKEGDWGAEKRTLQTELGTLKESNLNLSANQKQLIKQIENQNKTSKTIAAALVDLKAEVSGLKNDKPVSQTDSTVQFTAQTPDFEYDLTIFNVKPFEFKTPTLTLNKVSFPNQQSINFHWKDDKKEGYPVGFSVINTNKYFKINDIQSYIIPEVKKTELDPNFWGKVGKFTKSTGGKIAFFGVGVIVGGILIK